MHFRVMTTDDVPQALDLWRSCEGVGLSDSDTPTGLATFLERNPDTSWVVFAEDRLVGTVLAGHDGRRGFLYHLATHAEFRRRELARSLLRHALGSLRSAGILKCHVMVFRTNQEGREFWRHMGWPLRKDIDVHSLVLSPEDLGAGVGAGQLASS
jgi:ribosomal protein S18 acetylase RimI-like enzyme